ncbi:proteasome assembly chaperone family protein [Candidatus Rhodoluna planktonica]|uniref:Carboxylate--amine ligase n=1 Tax=Candidatus Rhodoluna planktonica TaxID=535712 RepID=A0A1D9DZ92_9MICO|nr:PAC2 family protein [Candidatus Rhodoluna planktonica]AOY56128.1 carboxylate--amine ligase [Candidatus Rhodoluna planktonica]
MGSFFSGRTLIVAFEGWNDAGEAASGAAKFLAQAINAEVVASVDPEEYYDFQFNRPTVSFGESGERVLSWPTTEFCIPGSNSDSSISALSLLVGTEPSRRWKSFTAEILEMIQDREIEKVLFLGAMLADVPHTRPISIVATSQNASAREILGIEKSQYEGPVGILSVLGLALEAEGIATVALWASVPHYVHNAPSPKATLALLIEVERYLGIQFDHGQLADEAFAWERGIDEIAQNDEEMANYILQLENNSDEAATIEQSANQLAAEFEEFLRSNDGVAKDVDTRPDSDSND